ncbi:MAG: hypothetical protein Q8O67_24325 [Deltaproteobacteria bacterium]|nr:hypothetical protein [Deltaproteobacteria bacterium]
MPNMPNVTPQAELELPSYREDDVVDDEAAPPVERRSVDQRMRELVAERPAVALLGAVALGFVVGRLLSRRL